MNFAPVVHGSHRDQQQVLASDFNSKEVYMSYDLNAEGVNGVKDQTVVVAISGFPSVFETPVWNVDGSAVGTPAIWGLTEGGQPAIRGRSTLDRVGVRGEVTSGTGDGVQGQGSGSSSGVAGFGGNVEEGQQPGAGVFGLGGTAAIGSFVPAVAPGVRGIGGGGGPGVVGIAGHVSPTDIPPDSTFANMGMGGFSDISVGVFGMSGSARGVVGHSKGGAGVAGDSDLGNGGYFSSATAAQIHLEPHKDFLADPNGTVKGKAGDLLVLRLSQQQLEPVATLWFCRSTGLSGWTQLA
jgi:hypothetical protein